MDPGTRMVRQGGSPLRLFSNGEPGPTDSFGLLGSQTLREYISVVLSHPNVWYFAMVAIGEIVESGKEHHAGGQYCLTLCDPYGLHTAHQAPLSMGFSRQEDSEGVAISFSRGIFLAQGLNLSLLCLSHWQADSGEPYGSCRKLPAILTCWSEVSVSLSATHFSPPVRTQVWE